MNKIYLYIFMRLFEDEYGRLDERDEYENERDIVNAY
jgi:hypothetical protein